jgi:NitT/TauT family transport system substrate-binding protein
MAIRRGGFIKLAGGASLGGFASATGTASGTDVRTVRVLEVPTDGAKSVLYAQQANIFRKHGISADIVPLGSGAAIFAAVLGGAADFGSGSTWPVYQAYARGLSLRIVAPATVYESADPDEFLLVRKDAPIRVPSDLNGKTFGGDNATDIGVMAARAWLDQHGGDGNSLRAIGLSSARQLEALEAGRIDAATLKPPFLTTAMESGPFRKLGTPFEVIGPRALTSCWVATADFITKNPDVVNGFVAGLTEAASYTNANQAATVDLVAAFTGQDAALLRRSVRSITATTVTMAELQRPLDFGYKCGTIDPHIDVRGLLASSVPLARA